MPHESVLFQVLIYITILTDAVIIENIYVPELLESGSSAILCCQFSSLDENDSVYWQFNGNRISTNESSSSITPSMVKQSLLSFKRVTPSMSGNYTCQVTGAGKAAQLTRHMLVFGPENDFILKVKYPNNRALDIKCTASGLYPRPEIDLEIDNKPVSNQMQRVWWRENSYVAEGFASLHELPEGKYEVTCRLHLPQADYTAIVKKSVRVGRDMSCGSTSTAANVLIISAIFWLGTY